MASGALRHGRWRNPPPFGHSTRIAPPPAACPAGPAASGPRQKPSAGGNERWAPAPGRQIAGRSVDASRPRSAGIGSTTHTQPEAVPATAGTSPRGHWPRGSAEAIQERQCPPREARDEPRPQGPRPCRRPPAREHSGSPRPVGARHEDPTLGQVWAAGDARAAAVQGRPDVCAGLAWEGHCSVARACGGSAKIPHLAKCGIFVAGRAAMGGLCGSGAPVGVSSEMAPGGWPCAGDGKMPHLVRCGHRSMPEPAARGVARSCDRAELGRAGTRFR